MSDRSEQVVNVAELEYSQATTKEINEHQSFVYNSSKKFKRLDG